MWRVEITELGRAPLPPIDLDGEELVLGSGERSAVRLPAAVARPRHLRLRKLADRDDRALVVAWVADAALTLQGAPRQAGHSGQATAPLVVQLGSYRIVIDRAPAGAPATAPARTESLARELLRGILGGVAPKLVIERGPEVGASRVLGPPESRLTIGRGDEADWVILDEDLSRVHAAVLRTWDGVTVSDLGSKNGTRVDGALLSSQEPGCALRDGALVELGAIRLRFSDETERHAAALAPPEQVAARPAAPPRAPSTLMLVGAAIVALALAAAAYLLLAG